MSTATWEQYLAQGLHDIAQQELSKAQNNFEQSFNAATDKYQRFHMAVAVTALAKSFGYLHSQNLTAAQTSAFEAKHILDGIINDEREPLIRLISNFLLALSQEKTDIAQLETACEHLESLPGIPKDFLLPFYSTLLGAMLMQGTQPEPVQTTIEKLTSLGSTRNHQAALSIGLAHIARNEWQAAQSVFEGIVNELENAAVGSSELYITAINALHSTLRQQEALSDTAEMYLDMGLELLDSVYPSESIVSLDSRLYAALEYIAQGQEKKGQAYLAQVLLNLDPVVFPIETIVCNQELLKLFAAEENTAAVADYEKRIAMVYEDSYGQPLPKDQSDKGEQANPEEQERYELLQKELATVRSQLQPTVHPQVKHYLQSMSHSMGLLAIRSVLELFASTPAPEAEKPKADEDKTGQYENPRLFDTVSQLMMEGKIDEALAAIQSELTAQTAILGETHLAHKPLLEGLLMIHTTAGNTSEAAVVKERLAALG